nr:hypothetical protein [uncultured Dysosmobacter sp.]
MRKYIVQLEDKSKAVDMCLNILAERAERIGESARHMVMGAAVSLDNIVYNIRKLEKFAIVVRQLMASEEIEEEEVSENEKI